MSSTVTAPDLSGGPAEIAARIVSALREHFPDPPELERERQVLALLEEVGEVTAAYRRWSGQARRAGTLAELRDELADVVLSAHVALIVLGADLADVWRFHSPDPAEPTTHGRVLALYDAAGRLSGLHLRRHAEWNHSDHVRHQHARRVADVLAATRHLADRLSVDLDAACQHKAGTIFTRDWRDPR